MPRFLLFVNITLPGWEFMEKPNRHATRSPNLYNCTRSIQYDTNGTAACDTLIGNGAPIGSKKSNNVCKYREILPSAFMWQTNKCTIHHRGENCHGYLSKFSSNIVGQRQDLDNSYKIDRQCIIVLTGCSKSAWSKILRLLTHVD